MKACLFNPENDLALAAGTVSYTPPRNARLLRDSGCMLPVWYAPSGSQVIVAAEDQRRWLDSVSSDYALEVDGVARFSADAEPMPWGWSVNVAKRFADLGVSDEMLPDSATLDILREMSHRHTSLEVLRRFNVTNLPVEAQTVADVEKFAREQSRPFYFKSPWSSTGRGVASSADMPLSEVFRRCDGIIARQGSVMLEPGLDKVQDFAMLFFSGDRGVRYVGLSLFVNEGNAYSGNLLMSDNDIARRIGRLVGDDSLNPLIESMPAILTDIVGGYYRGYLGVDMMVCRDWTTGRPAIFPCIEINLRMTMGVVAHIWRERFLAPGVNGRLVVDYRRTDGGSQPVIDNHRLVSGTQSLVVPNADFAIYVAAE